MRTGPRWPRVGQWTRKLAERFSERNHRRSGIYRPASAEMQQLQEGLRHRLSRGETLYFVGLGAAGHNAGVGLIEVSRQGGLRLLGNDEEERFTGIKHFAGYPQHALEVLRQRLAGVGRTPDDVAAWCLSWDYPAAFGMLVSTLMQELPASRQLLRSAAMPKWDFTNTREVRHVPGKLQAQLGLSRAPVLWNMPHHENHASLAYALSPFFEDGEPTLVLVLDGFGDAGAISVYEGRDGRLTHRFSNESLVDSLGLFYSVVSSTQGGWTTLSSEGRYMGAVAWGNSDRLTNPFYRGLREIFQFGPEGRIEINRNMANWQCSGELAPYARRLVDLLGPPIPPERLWNPDSVLNVEEVEHSPITRQRVDIAAATQLVLEDAVFHIVDHQLRSTGCPRLVMTGGTALNCLVNMRLLDRYNEDWFEREMGQRQRLSLWVPPIPGDAGVTAGAACSLALRLGVPKAEPLTHAFYCGLEPSTEEIAEALDERTEMESAELGSIENPEELHSIADQLARLVANNCVVGLFRGAAETGPRALGHRSILANPCDPDTLKIINERVKFREIVRPLAPMMTQEAAEEFFELAPGAAKDQWNAYRYMVLTVKARRAAKERIPAVIHRDGTARIQIVRAETDPLCHAYLVAMGRYTGCEVSVNTSLNVGSPIVQTPQQALVALTRARGMTALLMVGSDGRARLAWETTVDAVKDGGQRLHELLDLRERDVALV